MQDFNYLFTSCLELTVEVENGKNKSNTGPYYIWFRVTYWGMERRREVVRKVVRSVWEMHILRLGDDAGLMWSFSEHNSPKIWLRKVSLYCFVPYFYAMFPCTKLNLFFSKIVLFTRYCLTSWNATLSFMQDFWSWELLTFSRSAYSSVCIWRSCQTALINISFPSITIITRPRKYSMSCFLFIEK